MFPNSQKITEVLIFHTISAYKTPKLMEVLWRRRRKDFYLISEFSRHFISSGKEL
jgi:hypothetical protein